MRTHTYLIGYFVRDGDTHLGAHAGPYSAPLRVSSKIDLMTELALEAAHHLRPLISSPPERVGMCIANRLGGWGFGEPEMVRLHESRFAPHVNVYLGTAWFPAAAQGEISIAYEYLGHSKTFAGDGTAYAEALDYATRLIQRRIADQVLVGAVEAANSPWLLKQLGTQPRLAAGFLLLGSEHDPKDAHHVAVDVQELSNPGQVPSEHMDTYPADTAVRVITRLDEAINGREPSKRTLVVPIGNRQIVFGIESKSS